jgi:drug/metabolite transporter (DMT)-like permease
MVLSPVILGMLLSAMAFLCFTCFDTATKFLAKDYSVFQIMSVEFIVGTLLLLVIICVTKRKTLKQEFRIGSWKLHLWRGLTQVAGQSCAFLALPHVSLAEFYVIIFCEPLLVAFISSWLLKEKMTAPLLVALMVSFVGILIALHPTGAFNPWSLMVLLAVVIIGFSLIVLRKMGESETLAMTTLSTAVFLAVGAIIPTLFLYKPMTLDAFGLMALGGVFFVIAQTMLSYAFRIAPAAIATSPQFLQLVYGAIAGYLVFGDVPSMWIYMGGTIVIAANLFLFWVQGRAVKPAV